MFIHRFQHQLATQIKRNFRNTFVHPFMFDECFNKVIFLRFYNELKFHILCRDEKVPGLSPGINMSVLSNSGHSTFVLSTINIQN